MTHDFINGLFELLGTPFVCLSIHKLHKDKQVRGLSWWQPLFFTLWGYWNLIYYPNINQSISFIGAIGLALVNTIWVLQLVYYTKKEKDVKIIIK